MVTDYLAWEGRVPPFDHGATFNSLNVPIRRGDNLLGVLYIDSLGSEREFDQEDLRLASLFANHAAIAIENARLLGALTQHKSDLQRLSAQLISAQSLAGIQYVSHKRLATYILQAFGETDVETALAELEFQGMADALDVDDGEQLPDEQADAIRAAIEALRVAVGEYGR